VAVPTVAEPIRVTTSQAAAMLAVDVRTVRRYCGEGLFTLILPNGVRGPGRRLFLLPDEVRVFGLEGPAALKAYRKAKAGTKKRGA
jgi:hypothetical protein